MKMKWSNVVGSFIVSLLCLVYAYLVVQYKKAASRETAPYNVRKMEPLPKDVPRAEQEAKTATHR